MLHSPSAIMDSALPAARHHAIVRILAAADEVILGKPDALRLALACLLARGHLLIEDLPGVGKTTLAHALARLLGLHFSRLQFTSDLLPADILGVSLYELDAEGARFRFVPGPVFAQVVLADEINRASPKTQSALLEAMEEGQVTVDGETRRLPEPFFVIATQNPSHQVGTFPLPESQLDRFLMRLSLGYPDPAAEKALLAGGSRRDRVDALESLLAPGDLAALQQAAGQVHAAAPVVDYVYALTATTRQDQRFRHGLSPRAALGLLAAARAHAFIDGRDHVLPEDVQAVFPAVAGHRLHHRGSEAGLSATEARSLIEAVPLP